MITIVVPAPVWSRVDEVAERRESPSGRARSYENAR